MALPPGISTVRVTFGPFVDFVGAPRSGSITLTPSTALLHNSGARIVPVPLTAALDATGAGELTVIATDDPSITPKDFTYTVSINITGLVAPPQALLLPRAVSVVDLELLTPVQSSTGVTIATPVVRTINGVAPDSAGNVQVVASGGGEGAGVSPDTPLTSFPTGLARTADMGNPETDFVAAFRTALA